MSNPFSRWSELVPETNADTYKVNKELEQIEIIIAIRIQLVNNYFRVISKATSVVQNSISRSSIVVNSRNRVISIVDT